VEYVLSNRVNSKEAGDLIDEDDSYIKRNRIDMFKTYLKEELDKILDGEKVQLLDELYDDIRDLEEVYISEQKRSDPNFASFKHLMKMNSIF